VTSCRPCWADGRENCYNCHSPDLICRPLTGRGLVPFFFCESLTTLGNANLIFSPRDRIFLRYLSPPIQISSSTPFLLCAPESPVTPLPRNLPCSRPTTQPLPQFRTVLIMPTLWRFGVGSPLLLSQACDCFPPDLRFPFPPRVVWRRDPRYTSFLCFFLPSSPEEQPPVLTLSRADFLELSRL